MSIEMTCPDCGKKVAVPDNLLGKRVRCPLCQQPFTVTAPEPLAEEIIEEVPEVVLPAPRGRRQLPDAEDLLGRRRPPRDELVPPPRTPNIRKQNKVSSVLGRELAAGVVIFGLMISGCCIFRVVTWFMFGGAFFGMPNLGNRQIDTPQNDQQVTEVLAATNDGDGFRRADAFNALHRAQVIEGRRGEVTARALTNIQDGNGFPREAARNVVRKWAGRENVPALIDLLDNNDAGVRHLALDVLGKLRDERAVVPIALRLGPDRDQASQALQNLGPMAEREVLQYVNDRDANLRHEACKILKRIGTNACVPELQRLQNTDPDNNVKLAARDALITLRSRK